MPDGKDCSGCAPLAARYGWCAKAVNAGYAVRQWEMPSSYCPKKFKSSAPTVCNATAHRPC